MAKRAKNVKSKRTNKRTRARKQSTGTRKMSILADPRAGKWERLLRDPCTAELAPPCYGGSDTGYLVRTVDIVSPTITVPTGTVGAATRLDVYLQYTPYNLSSSSGLVIAGGLAWTGLTTAAAAGISNFIGSSTSPAYRYRPVACCLKWIPDGQSSLRAGTVGQGYSPGMPLAAGSIATTASGLLASAQLRTTSGMQSHEVRWLPTAVDENFTSTVAPSTSGAGTVFTVLLAVDGVYTNTTSASPSGRFEITTVWEWTPSASGLGAGLSIAPTPPTPYTSQQVLSTIQDMGQFLFRGLRSAQRIADIASPYVNIGGFGIRTGAGASLPLLRY